MRNHGQLTIFYYKPIYSYIIKGNYLYKTQYNGHRRAGMRSCIIKLARLHDACSLVIASYIAPVANAGIYGI